MISSIWNRFRFGWFWCASVRNTGLNDAIFFLSSNWLICELINLDYAVEKEAERTDLCKKLNFGEKKCYFNFSFSTYFLSHTYELKKNIYNITDQNADDQIFLFHVIFVFFVKKKIESSKSILCSTFFFYFTLTPNQSQIKKMNLWTYKYIPLTYQVSIGKFFFLQ